MIFYQPLSGDVDTTPISYKVKTCFLMAQLGKPIPPILDEVRGALTKIFRKNGYNVIDANSRTTGRDYLVKILKMASSVPVGIAIVHEGIKPQTMSNIFYELGWMQALGKETLIIKVGKVKIPSDFVRTEYVEYSSDFENKLKAFLDSLQERSEYYVTLADTLENNPLLQIDYLKRAFLLTGDLSLSEQAKEIQKQAGISGRAKNSVEMLMINF